MSNSFPMCTELVSVADHKGREMTVDLLPSMWHRAAGTRTRTRTRIELELGLKLSSAVSRITLSLVIATLFTSQVLPFDCRTFLVLADTEHPFFQVDYIPYCNVLYSTPHPSYS